MLHEICRWQTRSNKVGWLEFNDAFNWCHKEKLDNDEWMVHILHSPYTEFLICSLWYPKLNECLCFIIRSTPPSRPNNIRGGNVRPYFRPQKVCSISMKLGVYIEVDEWCMTVCSMTQFKVKVMGPLKFRKLRFSNSVSSTIYWGSWQVTSNS